MEEKKEKWKHFKSVMEHCLGSGDSFEDSVHCALNNTEEYFSQPKFQKGGLCTISETGNYFSHDSGAICFVVARGEIYIVTPNGTVVFDKEDGAWGEFECDKEVRDFLNNF